LDQLTVEKIDPTYWWADDHVPWKPKDARAPGRLRGARPGGVQGLEARESHDQVIFWGKKISGKMFVERSALERLFPPASALPLEIDPHLPASRGYVSPYLSFMIRAAAQLDLAPNKREKKHAIEMYLRDNWPAELGQVSGEKVSYMATFLRSPQHERGGNFHMEGGACGSVGVAQYGCRKIKRPKSANLDFQRVPPKAPTLQNRRVGPFEPKGRTLRPLPCACFSSLLLSIERPWRATDGQTQC
jgi:hypothetical protein